MTGPYERFAGGQDSDAGTSPAGQGSTSTDNKVSQSESIVRLATELYRIGQSQAGEPFAIEHEGPNIARMFRSGRSALRAILAREYRRMHGLSHSLKGIRRLTRLTPRREGGT